MTKSNPLIDAAASFGVTFGTDAPYAAEEVRAARIGFASIPSVVLTVYARQQDLSAIVPVARQIVFRELASAGIDPACLKATPTVGVQSRRRKMTDTNERSRSFGKQKMLHPIRFTFEVADLDYLPSLRTLPRSFEGSAL